MVIHIMYITNCICNGFIHFYKEDYICIYSLQSVWSYFLSIKTIKTIFNRYELTSPLIFHNRFLVLFVFIGLFCIEMQMKKLPALPQSTLCGFSIHPKRQWCDDELCLSHPEFSISSLFYLS